MYQKKRKKSPKLAGNVEKKHRHARRARVILKVMKIGAFKGVFTVTI